MRERREVTDAWGPFIAGLGEWHLFGALTYDPRRPGGQRTLPAQVPGQFHTPRRLQLAPRISEDGLVRLDARPRARDRAVGDVSYFLREGQRQLGRKIEAAVVALEYQKNGWPHFHPLLRLEGGLQLGDIAVLGPLWFKLAGYGRLEVPRSNGDVASYAAKYLSKGLEHGDVVFWPHGDLRVHQSGIFKQ